MKSTDYRFTHYLNIKQIESEAFLKTVELGNENASEKDFLEAVDFHLGCWRALQVARFYIREL